MAKIILCIILPRAHETTIETTQSEGVTVFKEKISLPNGSGISLSSMHTLSMSRIVSRGSNSNDNRLKFFFGIILTIRVIIIRQIRCLDKIIYFNSTSMIIMVIVKYLFNSIND